MILVIATVALVLHRVSLPPYSIQSEGRYVGYGLHVWFYLAGEVPLSLALLLAGILLWPLSPDSPARKKQGFSLLVVTLISLMALARMAYS